MPPWLGPRDCPAWPWGSHFTCDPNPWLAPRASPLALAALTAWPAPSPARDSEQEAGQESGRGHLALSGSQPARPCPALPFQKAPTESERGRGQAWLWGSGTAPSPPLSGAPRQRQGMSACFGVQPTRAFLGKRERSRSSLDGVGIWHAG